MLFKVVDSEKTLIDGKELSLAQSCRLITNLESKDYKASDSYWAGNRYIIKGSSCLLMHKHKNFFYTVSMILKPEFGDCHPHISKTIQGTLITTSLNEEVLYFIRSFMER